MPRSAQVVLALALLTAAFFAGSWFTNRSGPAAATQAAPQIQYYACPMHPQFHSDRPGDCPSCGMRLEPVHSGSATPGAASMSSAGVQIDPDKQQVLGIRVARVQRGSGPREFRTVGRVVADETRVYRINAATDGWIRKLGPATTGSLVKKQDVLATFYSPPFLAAIQSYLYSLNAPEPVRLSTSSLQQVKNTLRSLGMSDAQLEELAKTHQTTQDIQIVSPVDGIVLSRDVSAGSYFVQGAEFYRIADLTRVWILADLFEREARYLRAGQSVTVQYQGQSFAAKASEVASVFDPATRTLKARFEMDNPAQKLWPDMFVDVQLPLNLPPAITVPADAVVDSGMRKTVYVAGGSGRFEPRVVETGWRFGDQVEIVKGLTEGEEIVVAGNFMLDSESRMRMPATQGGGETKEHAGQAQAPAKDPVCGMDVDISNPAGKRVYKGTTYYFCSDHCVKRFDSHPEEYVGETGKK